MLSSLEIKYRDWFQNINIILIASTRAPTSSAAAKLPVYMYSQSLVQLPSLVDTLDLWGHAKLPGAECFFLS